MSEKDTIYSEKVKHEGVWHFKDTYKFLFSWFIDNGYIIIEKKYSEKITAKGKEIEIEWYAKKKISDYFRFIIRSRWVILGMTSVEVQQEGRKIPTNKGEIEIKFDAILERDYEHRWENNGFLKFLRGVYNRYIIKGRIDDYEDRIVEEVNELIAQMKAWLVLEGKR